MKRWTKIIVLATVVFILLVACNKKVPITPNLNDSTNSNVNASLISGALSNTNSNYSYNQSNNQSNNQSENNASNIDSNTQNSDSFNQTSNTNSNIVINSTLKVGDYVKIGKYNGDSVIWRCVDKNINGPLLLSDKILTIKAFDAGGTNLYLDGKLQTDDTRKSREANGSNLWETSCLRAWLNSDAVSGNVAWLGGSPPISKNLKDGVNAYSGEKGFLNTDNFTTKEKKWIKSVSQKQLLGTADYTKLKTDGTELLTNKGGFLNYGNEPIMQSFSEVLANYSKAYYHKVSDKIFILDLEQLNKISLNTKVLGENYYIGKPTQKLIETSQFKDLAFLNTKKYWYTWTRTPVCDENITSVYALSFNMPGSHTKGVYYISANHFYLGVRPAFYIYMEPEMFIDGDGSITAPYILK